MIIIFFSSCCFFYTVFVKINIMIFVFNSKIKLSDVCVKKTFFIFLLPGLVYSLLFFFLVQNRLPANTELATASGVCIYPANTVIHTKQKIFILTLRCVPDICGGQK